MQQIINILIDNTPLRFVIYKGCLEFQNNGGSIFRVLGGL